MLFLYPAAIAVLLALNPLTDARFTQRHPGGSTRDNQVKCDTNSDCLRLGQGPLRPRALGGPTFQRRQTGGFDPISDSTCGVAHQLFLMPGTYYLTATGAAGGAGTALGGNGAVVTAKFIATKNSSIGYYVGCPGGTYSNVGGGGGGTFVYVSGDGQGPLLIAGGGGGSGYSTGANGGAAGTSLTNTYGTGGYSGGANGGGGGAGFTSAGSSASTPVGKGVSGYVPRYPADKQQGGSQSINFSGNFAGGERLGGGGGGGGLGFIGGGGGGGNVGGKGGSGSQGLGGAGGSSLARSDTAAGITVTPDTAAATSTGSGSLQITTQFKG